MGIKLRKTDSPGHYIFYCRACKCHHAVWTQEYQPGHPFWTFNNDMEKPSFKPSLLVQTPDKDGNVQICHFFIEDGKMRYMNDCTHDLHNQTVEMEDVE
jgi:hypothetical protein